MARQQEQKEGEKTVAWKMSWMSDEAVLATKDAVPTLPITTQTRPSIKPLVVRCCSLRRFEHLDNSTDVNRAALEPVFLIVFECRKLVT